MALKMNRICRMTKELIDDEERGFRPGRGICWSNFYLKQLAEKSREEVKSVYKFYSFWKGVWLGKQGGIMTGNENV